LEYTHMKSSYIQRERDIYLHVYLWCLYTCIFVQYQSIFYPKIDQSVYLSRNAEMQGEREGERMKEREKDGEKDTETEQEKYRERKILFYVSVLKKIDAGRAQEREKEREGEKGREG